MHAVDGVSFDVDAGETLALVGESGCGKSTTGRLVLRLLEPTSGSVHFDGATSCRSADDAMRELRGALQIIFQDPFASLNPRMTVGQTLDEPLALHGLARGAAARARGARSCASSASRPSTRGAIRTSSPAASGSASASRARSPSSRASSSATSRCRRSTCRSRRRSSTCCATCSRGFGLSYLFIAHDLAVVKFIATRVAVMYLGQIVEFADKRALFARPRHPYTQALLSAIPVPRPGAAARPHRARRRRASPSDPPSGCRFRTRCPHARPLCAEEDAAARRRGRPCGRLPLLARDRAAGGVLPGTAAAPRNPRLEALQAAFRARVTRRDAILDRASTSHGERAMSTTARPLPSPLLFALRCARCRVSARRRCASASPRIRTCSIPTLARTFVGRIVFAALCDKLFDIDEKLDDRAAARGELYEWSADGKALTIKVRPGRHVPRRREARRRRGQVQHRAPQDDGGLATAAASSRW